MFSLIIRPQELFLNSETPQKHFWKTKFTSSSAIFFFDSLGFWMVSEEYFTIVNEPCSTIMSLGRTLLFFLPAQGVRKWRKLFLG